MKKIIYLSLVLFSLTLMSFSACNKSDVVEPVTPEYSLIGNWKFESVDYDGITDTTYLKNNGYELYKFDINFDKNNIDVTIYGSKATNYYKYYKTDKIINIKDGVENILLTFEYQFNTQEKLILKLINTNYSTKYPINASYFLNKI